MNFIEIEKTERKNEWAMSQLQSHDYYEIYFLLEGKRKIFFENKMFNIEAGTVCIIPPFFMHKTEGDAYTRININLSPDLLTSDERSFLDSCTSVAYRIESKSLSTITSLLELANKENSSPKQDKKLLHFAKVIFALLTEHENVLTPVDYNATVNVNKKDTTILNIVSYLNENFAEKITLSSLSKKFYISINTLCTRFNNSMRCTVMEYLNYVRISTAKKLLTTTNYDMDKIASSCGFASANYFSLIFKKHVGLSPLKYRKGK